MPIMLSERFNHKIHYDFIAAESFVRRYEGPQRHLFNPPSKLHVQLYALSQKAILGSQSALNSSFSVGINKSQLEIQKGEAWKELEDMTSEQAMIKYVEIINSLVEHWREYDARRNVLSTFPFTSTPVVLPDLTLAPPRDLPKEQEVKLKQDTPEKKITPHDVLVTSNTNLQNQVYHLQKTLRKSKLLQLEHWFSRFVLRPHWVARIRHAVSSGKWFLTGFWIWIIIIMFKQRQRQRHFLRN